MPDFVVQMTPLPAPQKEIIAIGGQWDALPRVPRRTNPDQVVYKEAVAEVLKKKGLKNPKIKITQVIRIDLDGDGVEEGLITADTYGDKLYRHLQKRGTYSLVLLRKVINGKVETLVIEEDYFPPTRKYGVPHAILGGGRPGCGWRRRHGNRLACHVLRRRGDQRLPGRGEQSEASAGGRLGRLIQAPWGEIALKTPGIEAGG